MSLDYELASIKDYKATCFKVAIADSPMDGITKGDKVLTGEVRNLIWLTMILGMDLAEKAGRLKKGQDVVTEFFWRVKYYERLLHPKGVSTKYDSSQKLWVDQPITLKEIKKYEGLYTNASQRTRSQFIKHVNELFQTGVIDKEVKALRESEETLTVTA